MASYNDVDPTQGSEGYHPGTFMCFDRGYVIIVACLPGTRPSILVLSPLIACVLVNFGHPED